MRLRLMFAAGLCLAHGACAGEIDKGPAALKGGSLGALGDAAVDGGSDLFSNPNRDAAFRNIPDGALTYSDATPTVDAFFINDPPPPYCGPAGNMPAEIPTGTLQCPSDKNREGCPCPEVGATAPCWPGQRLNRDHGICHDGTAVCQNAGEFGLRWSACDGYVLPTEGALSGPEACGCFSKGSWSLTNLSPCIFRGNQTYLYSSYLDGSGAIQCGGPFGPNDAPPAPSVDWTQSSLNVDCAGQFRLCFTIKAGDVANPQPTDCVITTQCLDVWYAEANVDQSLPSFAGWTTTETACASAFDLGGGYGEMSVLGTSIECDAVDDGMGNPYIFHRTNYCPPSCQQTPTTPECISCVTGGSGSFGGQ